MLLNADDFRYIYQLVNFSVLDGYSVEFLKIVPIFSHAGEGPQQEV